MSNKDIDTECRVRVKPTRTDLISGSGAPVERIVEAQISAGSGDGGCGFSGFLFDHVRTGAGAIIANKRIIGETSFN